MNLFAALIIAVFTPSAFAEMGSLPTQPKDIMPRDGLPVDFRLRKNVDFWVDIYSKYESRQGVLHDSKYVDKIYEIVDLKRGGGIREAKRRWREVLMSLHKKEGSQEALTEDERRIQLLFADVTEPDKYLAASHRRRLRLQHGQKDMFREGLIQSGRYLPAMEEHFKAAGLPRELTRLPFVESSFNTMARSKVGASGIFQFMRSTGRLFLTINDSVDERNDPIRATEAAAKLLRMNYESLQSWPLAVTAYNHGRKGMMRAVRKVGTDNLGEIVTTFRSRNFGFASGNFYTELLAAIEVERDSEKYFPGLVRNPPLQAIEARIPDYVNLKMMARFLKLNLKQIKAMNPALASSVFTGKKLLPAGYQLRLPYDGSLDREASVRVFLAGYSRVPAIYKQRAQRGSSYGRKLTSTTEESAEY